MAGCEGFVLLELIIALALIGLLIGVALPHAVFRGGTADLRAAAAEIAALLRADRNAALRYGQPVTAIVDFMGHRVRSGGAGGEVAIPAEIALRVSSEGRAGIRFYPDGTASGGEIFLARVATGANDLLAVRIDRVTAAVTIRVAVGTTND
ncbi:GspH/FimT family pseudopilin [Methylobacterium nigriterrae]|uniref:GspH/FimT family pseudopilin n=1 Tax=Methylobacterium nigriterrae TaxID=3127512 RepID=UPI003013BE8E